MSECADPPVPEDAAEFPCPKCGAAMVRRVAKQGEHAGERVLGLLGVSEVPFDRADPGSRAGGAFDG